MEENLVIVESPAKAKTIEKFLGNNFLVKSSMGHIRDLAKKDLGINMDNNYEPEYVISEDKKKIVAELKKLAKQAKLVWLASDEDREGEAISWHLSKVLELEDKQIKRIVFHEITKEAIQNAVKKPRSIDINLVNSQQARRVLDRIVGYELSPVLWKKVKPQLSAGRVQSVSVRLIVEREREIIGFQSTSSYRIRATFHVPNKDGKIVEMKAELPKRFNTKEETLAFLEKCKNAKFTISDIVTKPAKRSPAPPFTTSTLQQEASRKLGFSVSQTMVIAQRLYEEGKITYMRTDSVNLSDLAINTAKAEIIGSFGQKYSNPRNYKTKSKSAQEAHEAIRPTYMNQSSVNGNDTEKKLYDLIWKRTIASQMSDAELERTSVSISMSTSNEVFTTTGEVIKFDGFLKVYIESTDDDKEDKPGVILPPLKVKQILDMQKVSATQKFTHYPPRYTEASLVKKLEELGIGRPSTYAPTISTIQQRGYVIKDSREGVQRTFDYIYLKQNKIHHETQKEMTGAEKNKLFPTDIGMVVNDFLMNHFVNILDFNFTASVEESLDNIADGKQEWHQMIDKFYKKFHPIVEKTLQITEYSDGMRRLGNDPVSGKPVIVRIGKFGPMAQIGDSNDENEKPRYSALRKGQLLDTITLEEALDLFKLPRAIGEYEEKEVVIGIGPFGPYVRHNSKFYSLKKGIDDPLTITLERAKELIEEKREADRNKIIKDFPKQKIQILNGRWGAYISYNEENYKIPKTQTPAEMTAEDCLKIIEATPKTPKAKGKKAFGKKAASKSTEKTEKEANTKVKESKTSTKKAPVKSTTKEPAKKSTTAKTKKTSK